VTGEFWLLDRPVGAHVGDLLLASVVFILAD
jgi:hypothetical protein